MVTMCKHADTQGVHKCTKGSHWLLNTTYGSFQPLVKTQQNLLLSMADAIIQRCMGLTLSYSMTHWWVSYSVDSTGKQLAP